MTAEHTTTREGPQPGIRLGTRLQAPSAAVPGACAAAPGAAGAQTLGWAVRTAMPPSGRRTSS